MAPGVTAHSETPGASINLHISKEPACHSRMLPSMASTPHIPRALPTPSWGLTTSQRSRIMFFAEVLGISLYCSAMIDWLKGTLAPQWEPRPHPTISAQHCAQACTPARLREEDAPGDKASQAESPAPSAAASPASQVLRSTLTIPLHIDVHQPISAAIMF